MEKSRSSIDRFSYKIQHLQLKLLKITVKLNPYLKTRVNAVTMTVMLWRLFRKSFEPPNWNTSFISTKKHIWNPQLYSLKKSDETRLWIEWQHFNEQKPLAGNVVDDLHYMEKVAVNEFMKLMRFLLNCTSTQHMKVSPGQHSDSHTPHNNMGRILFCVLYQDVQ